MNFDENLWFISSLYSLRQARGAFLIAYGNKGVESGEKKEMKLHPQGQK
jgi:hypothetical protein